MQMITAAMPGSEQMNKAEAIKHLEHCGAEPYCYDYQRSNCRGCNARKALNMGIDALRQSIAFDHQVENLRRKLHKEMFDD